ncbi:MAG: MFS transporter [Candidatus Marsarchaeota archaeon]|nr:MFS transporter [Candidatus Marsarchaeota archaeon]
MPKSSNIAGRLERLPSSPYFYTLIVLIAMGTFWDSYMLFSIGGIATHFFTVTGTKYFAAYLPALLFGGTFIGAILMGTLGDHIGRRNAFTLDVAILAIGATIAVASSSLIIFGIGLFIAGLGTGAEIPLSSTYSQEFAPTARRGYINVLELAIGFAGGTVGGFADLFLVPTFPFGYKLVLLIAAIGGFLTLLMRLKVPESPRWLESKGRTVMADQIMSLIEKKTMLSKGIRKLPLPKKMPEPLRRKWSLSSLFKGKYRRRTASAWAIEFFQGFGFYGFASFVPIFLHGLGYSIVSSLLYTALIQIAYPVGTILTTTFVDKVPRKTGMGVLYFINMLVGVGFLLSGVYHGGAILIVLFGFLTELLIFMDGPLLHTYEAEIYPAYARGSGSSMSFSLSRLGGFVAPLLGGFLLVLYPTTGYITIIAWAAAAWIICSIIAFTLAVNTKNLSLEELEVESPKRG